MTSTEFRQFRNDLRTSQESIARILGVDRRTIIRWESGESPRPSPSRPTTSSATAPKWPATTTR